MHFRRGAGSKALHLVKQSCLRKWSGLDSCGLPEVRVFSLPLLFRSLGALDLNALPIGNVAEVAEHGALLGIGDFCIERLVFADGIDEILEVGDVAQAGHILLYELAGVVMDPVAAAVE